MDIAEIVNDKTLKAKQKAETLSQLLQDNKISSDEMVSFTQTAKDSSIATCIEAQQ